MAMLNPLWLKSFAMVVRARGFTEAATRLGLRQSTVSDHVRKLERECGRRLLIRDTHSLAMTADGEAMLGFADSILAVHDRAIRHFVDDDLKGHVRLGVSEDVVLGGFPHALRAFVKAHPRLELELTVGVSEALRAKLDEGKLDLVLLKRLVGETHGELMWNDPLVWAAARDFRLDPARPVPLVMLAPPALTRSIALAAMEERGCDWRLLCSSDSQSGVHAAVHAGLGIAPHARSLLPTGLVEFEHKRLPPLGTTEFVILSRKGASGGSIKAVSAMLSDDRILRRDATEADPGA